MIQAYPNILDPASEIGHTTGSLLANGEEVIVLRDLPFAQLEPDQQRRYISELSSAIGTLTLTGGQAGSELWQLDSQTSPHAAAIPFHTDNPYLQNPEVVVGFWCVRSSSQGGQNVFLPRDHFFDWAESKRDVLEVVESLGSSAVTFTHNDHQARGPVVSRHGQPTFRHDMKYVSEPDQATAQQFAELLERPDLPTQAVKLAPGDAVFFRNNDVLHARTPYSDPNRLSVRVRVGGLASQIQS